MKRITLLFIAIIACLVTVAAQVDTSAVQQSATDTQIEYTDTPDTNNSGKESRTSRKELFADLDFNSSMLIPIIAIVCGCALPVVIVFIAFYFRYKNRKAKYKLAEQALASGQPIPEDFFGAKAEQATLHKGITNTFTGIGLFILLWALASFSVATVGLLVMFMGLGQIVIHYASQNNKKENRKDTHRNDNNISIEE